MNIEEYAVLRNVQFYQRNCMNHTLNLLVSSICVLVSNILSTGVLNFARPRTSCKIHFAVWIYVDFVWNIFLKFILRWEKCFLKLFILYKLPMCFGKHIEMLGIFLIHLILFYMYLIFQQLLLGGDMVIKCNHNGIIETIALYFSKLIIILIMSRNKYIITANY